MSTFRSFARRALTFGLLAGLANCAPGLVAPRSTGLGGIAPFPIGVSVYGPTLKNNPRYREAILRDFNSVTAEVEMKMGALKPVSATEYNWEDADYLVKFAKDNRMRVHGHTLIWHVVQPRWLETLPNDSATWEAVMRDHIQTTIRHFKGDVHAWDVVNEAYETSGELSNTMWRKHLGPGYVARAFRYARAADPKAKLFYNDFDLEGGPNKLNAVLVRLDELKAQGVPIDGVGLQMHSSLTTHTPSVIDALEKLAARGYLIHISEMDVAVNLYNLPTTRVLTPQLLADQKQKYKEIVAAYLKIPRLQQYGITMWGVHDGQTWLRENRPEWPLLLDDDFKYKPAYEGFVEALRGK
ncbi:endo-1,4-beta-xylanase [Hymenobacter sp. BT175]|uniref:endo-1,4-beta-xylanase n=1 Tax=Hymenobacter translucens TaxID=2886507 RepID=UPI001D0EFAE3|nr:endo-1,4-beta-xylanase [Hymenobacter translucens]MCC2548032.1 endo-1,4-beta-xylanase [Hymenobacter translucens]